MKNLILLFAVALSLPLTANALNMGFYGGLNMTEFDSETLTLNSDVGFDLGVVTIFDFGSPVKMRTGVGYAQKNSSAKVPDLKLKLAYLEVPVTVLYDFNELIGVFGGLNLDLKMADECSISDQACGFKEVKSVVYNLVGGGRFKIMGPSFVEAFFEMGLSDTWKDTKIGTSFGARYVYMF